MLRNPVFFEHAPNISAPFKFILSKPGADVWRMLKKTGFRSIEHRLLHLHHAPLGAHPRSWKMSFLFHGARARDEKRGGDPKNTTKTGEENEFTVPVERQQQIGVAYALVSGRRFTRRSARWHGRSRPDAPLGFCRAHRWLCGEAIRHLGRELVEKNQPLMSIYSPELLTTQREFVMLLKMRDEAGSRETRETPEQLIASAKIRLKQWNVTDEQSPSWRKAGTPARAWSCARPFAGSSRRFPPTRA